MTDLLTRLQNALAGAYVIERELGGGGMSHVFLATERQLDRKVVVKLLPPDLAAGVSLERFHREIQLVARLQNPHIVPVIAAGEADGVPFFTMPFVEGRSLREMLSSETPVSVTDGVNILRDVATALGYAHERGIVHRDIKPDNVLLSGGAAVVTDFGVAKAISSAREATAAAAPGGSLTQIGFSLGTPMYMAPEQAAADPNTDHRADIYSFGTMAYELFAGHAPFAGRTPAALLAAQITETPPLLSTVRPDAPVPLVELIRRCLEKDPAKRPQNASEIIRALDQALASSGAAALGITAQPPRARTRPIVLAVSFAVVFVVATITSLLISRRGGDGTAAAATPRSIAVLPLENAGGSDSDRYFSEGITDELTSALGKVPGLRVASRTSVFALRGKGMDAQEIAKTLKVSSILEGTIRRSGDRLRVTAQLTNARDGLALWSDRYEREMKDVFEVQDDIAGSIVDALKMQLAPSATAQPAGAQGGAARSGTEDLAAYDLYLRGRYFWHQRGNDALQRAAGYFQQAIDRDPKFARAHAGLADVLGLLPIYGSTPADSAFPLARKAAERALELDSTLAEAHTTLGLILKSTGEWNAATTEFRRGIALDSNYATGHQWYAEVLIITGRVRQAIVELERAHGLDPLSPVINAELGYTLGLAGRYRDGAIAGRRAIALDSTLWIGHAFLAYTHLFSGDYAAAVSGFERAVRLGQGIDPLAGTLAYALARAGRADSARKVLLPIEQRANDDGSPIAVSMGYAGLGERDASLAWLERAVQQKDPWLYAMSINAPVFDSIRGDPRFAEAAKRMGLDPAVMRKTSKET